MMDAKGRAKSRLRGIAANILGGNPFGTGRLDVNDVDDFVDQVIEASGDAFVKVAVNATIDRIEQRGLPDIERLRARVDASDRIVNALRAKLNGMEAPAPAPTPPEWEVFVIYRDASFEPNGQIDKIGRYASEAEAERVANVLNNMTPRAYFFECEQV